jgi:hypothetical protein
MQIGEPKNGIISPTQASDTTPLLETLLVILNFYLPLHKTQEFLKAESSEG